MSPLIQGLNYRSACDYDCTHLNPALAVYSACTHPVLFIVLCHVSDTTEHHAFLDYAQQWFGEIQAISLVGKLQ